MTIMRNQIEEQKVQIDQQKVAIDQNDKLINALKQIVEKMEAKVEDLWEKQLPIGSIIPWYGSNNSNTSLPNGWQLCDGSPINSPSPMYPGNTPDLNEPGYFIRGGTEDEAGDFEDAAMQNHTHEDPGHIHTV